MRVRIEIFATLREKYGVKYIEVECSDFKSAIEEASKVLGREFYYEVFNEKDELRSDRIITVNGRNVKDVGSLRLKDGDRIAIFPPIAGG